MTRLIYFITHPNVVINAEVPIPEWSLSDLGRERMRLGLRQPWTTSITSIYCSTEQKAIDGATILGQHLSLNWTEARALGEIDRLSTGFLPEAEFETVANKFFAAPQACIRGWERAIDAQQRIWSAVDRIVATDATSGTIAIVSHGALGALLYCKLTGQEISRRYDQPPNGGGNYFSFSLLPTQVYSSWLAVDQLPQR